MLGSTLPCTRQPSQQRIPWLKIEISPSLRNPVPGKWNTTSKKPHIHMFTIENYVGFQKAELGCQHNKNEWSVGEKSTICIVKVVFKEWRMRIGLVAGMWCVHTRADPEEKSWRSRAEGRWMMCRDLVWTATGRLVKGDVLRNVSSGNYITVQTSWSAPTQTSRWAYRCNCTCYPCTVYSPALSQTTGFCFCDTCIQLEFWLLRRPLEPGIYFKDSLSFNRPSHVVS